MEVWTRHPSLPSSDPYFVQKNLYFSCSLLFIVILNMLFESILCINHVQAKVCWILFYFFANLNIHIYKKPSYTRYKIPHFCKLWNLKYHILVCLLIWGARLHLFLYKIFYDQLLNLINLLKNNFILLIFLKYCTYYKLIISLK